MTLRFAAGLLAVTVAVALIADPRHTAAEAPPALRLTQLSSREFVDLSKISLVQLPVYTLAPPGCNDCQTRWGATYILDGAQVAYTEEAEVALRKLLGLEPK